MHTLSDNNHLCVSMYEYACKTINLNVWVCVTNAIRFKSFSKSIVDLDTQNYIYIVYSRLSFHVSPIPGRVKNMQNENIYLHESAIVDMLENGIEIGKSGY